MEPEIFFCEEVSSEIADFRSPLKISGRLNSDRKFVWRKLQAESDFRSSPHLAIIILKGVRMHRKFRKFRHGGTCNIVPGPRGLTGTEHPRLFPDLCGPDFLIQRVDHRERVPLVHLLSVYLKS